MTRDPGGPWLRPRHHTARECLQNASGDAIVCGHGFLLPKRGGAHAPPLSLTGRSHTPVSRGLLVKPLADQARGLPAGQGLDGFPQLLLHPAAGARGLARRRGPSPGAGNGHRGPAVASRSRPELIRPQAQPSAPPAVLRAASPELRRPRTLALGQLPVAAPATPTPPSA